MICRSCLLLIFSLLCSLVLPAQPLSTAEQIHTNSFNPSTLLWYDQPARKWEEALPVGNGLYGEGDACLVTGSVIEHTG